MVYGFMPAKATLFDQRVKPIHEFGANPQNFVSWNPQGRLLALAGFGNLAGTRHWQSSHDCLPINVIVKARLIYMIDER